MTEILLSNEIVYQCDRCGYEYVFLATDTQTHDGSHWKVLEDVHNWVNRDGKHYCSDCRGTR